VIPEPVSTGVGRVKSIKDGARPNFLVINHVSFLNDLNEFCETRFTASTTPRLREAGPKLEERREVRQVRS
jgi:hypothetical protein